MGSRRTPRFVAAASGLLAVATIALSAHLSTALFLRVASADSAPQVQGISTITVTSSAHDRRVVLRLVNRSRAAHHLAPLRLNLMLSRLAFRHSCKMLRAGTLFHTVNLSQRMLSNTHAHAWGENIAMGPTLGGINAMWMGSAPHRANILNPKFRRAAIGVAFSGGTYWITFDFYG